MNIIKRKISKVWVPAFLAVFVMSSCSLDIEETDSLITDEDAGIFEGVADVGGSLDNIYNNITGQTNGQDNLYALTEVTTDELLVPTRGTDWGDNGVWRTLHAHTWGPTHAHLLTVWNDKNSAVLRATEVIDPLSGASAGQVAEAKFARAYNMWIIMDFYGQQPFRNPTDGVDVIPEVLSRSEAYALVVQDLTDAIADLPASNPAAGDKSRPVKATAQFWLAKTKLNAHIYNGSDAPANADMAEVISLVNAIEAEGYGLVDGYFDLFPGSNASNAEVIWSVNTSAGNRAWNGLHYNQSHSGNGGGGWNGFSTLAEFYDLFEGDANSNVIGGGQEERRGYTHTAATTTEENEGFGFGFQIGQMYGWRDGEGKALSDRVGGPLSFTKDLPSLVGNSEVGGIRLLKYSPANGAFDNGVVMARFADAHLMRAEAEFRMGNAGVAATEIDELRTLRGATLLGSVTEQDIIDERGRELYTEGWRRNDLIRFGQFTSQWSFKDGAAIGDVNKNLFPIPASALLSNPGLIQNDGY